MSEETIRFEIGHSEFKVYYGGYICTISEQNKNVLLMTPNSRVQNVQVDSVKIKM